MSSHEGSFDSKKLYLEAVLAEYKRLSEESANHSKNMSYIFAVLIGGTATILGVFRLTNITSFIIVPIFVSGCGAIMLGEGLSGAFVSYYIAEEIEHKKMFKEMFPQGSPIQYQGQYESRYGWLGGVFWSALFLLSICLCFACLIALTSFWNEISQDVRYQVFYFFAWAISAFYTIASTIGFFKLHGRLRQMKALVLKT